MVNIHHTYIHHFSGAPRGAFQQPVYSKWNVRWLRVLVSRPLSGTPILHSQKLSPVTVTT